MSQTAIAYLKQARKEIVERHERDLAELDTAIASLERAGDDAQGTSNPARRRPRPGQYRGMKLPVALHAYLSEQAGDWIPLKSVVADLQSGGVSLGRNPERYERNIKIALSNNRSKFEYNETTDSVRLRGINPQLHEVRCTA